MRKQFDCIVIGAGPGGMTAALYLKRFQRKVLVVHSGPPRAAWIPKTKNLIGYQGGISGPTLLRRLKSQLLEIGVPLREGQATVSRRGGVFSVSAGGQTYVAKKVLLATGIRDLQPNIPGLNALRRKGLLRYCPICDGFEHKGKKLLLFVTSKDCLDKIFFLFQFTRRLVVIVPPDFSPGPGQLKKYPRLKVKFVRTTVESMRASKNGVRAVARDGKVYEASAAYVELGFRVRDEAFSGIKNLRRAADGRIKVNEEQKTSVPGLFAVGDCVAALAQISVAAGQAAVAATAVHNELLQEARRS